MQDLVLIQSIFNTDPTSDGSRLHLPAGVAFVSEALKV